MLRLVTAIVGLVLGSSVLLGLTRGDEAARVVDQGTFTHLMGGTRIGEERFIIREERAGSGGSLFVAGAELNRKVDGEASRIRVALEVIGRYALPRRYEADINDSDASTIVAVLVRDRLRLNVSSSEGQDMRQFLVAGRAVILDSHIAHQYFFLTRLLGANPTAEVTVFVPQEQKQMKVKVEDQGESEVTIEGRSYLLRHLTVSASEMATHHAWLYGDRVIRVEIPDDEWLATRADVKALLIEEKGAQDE